MSFKQKLAFWRIAILLAVWSPVVATAEFKPRGETLTLGTQATMTTLDPSGLGTLPGMSWLASLAYDPLMWLEPNGAYSPGLATKWEFTEGNKNFNFSLRPDVKFSDGTPLDADAVAASLNYAFKNPASRGALYAPGFKLAKATGPLAVTIACDPACPAMPWLLTQWVLMGSIISPAGLKNPEKLGTQMSGTGPYTFNEKETVSGDRYVFDANPNYWNPDRVQYKRVVVRVIRDDTARKAALQTGQVDLIDYVSPQEASTISSKLALHRGTANFTGLVIHDTVGRATEGDPKGRTYSEPLANPLVRQALNYAIDRKTLAAGLGRGFAKPLGMMATPGTTAHDPVVDNFYSYDPKKAKALLAQAGYPNGFTLDVTVGSYVPETDNWAQAAAQYWEAIGVKVRLNATRTLPIWIQQAQTAPSIFFISGGMRPFVGQIYYYFNKGTTYSQWHVDPELEKMVDQAAVASEQDQAKIHKEMAKRAVEQGYWVPIAHFPMFFAYDPKKIKLNIAQDEFAGLPIVQRITPAQ